MQLLLQQAKQPARPLVRRGDVNSFVKLLELDPEADSDNSLFGLEVCMFYLNVNTLCSNILYPCSVPYFTLYIHNARLCCCSAVARFVAVAACGSLKCASCAALLEQYMTRPHYAAVADVSTTMCVYCVRQWSTQL
jgi:hypothetical protein